MSGIPGNIEEQWAGTLAFIRKSHPWHRNAFIIFNVLLTALNIYGGPPWWGLWPLLITGLIYALHYLIYKASVIDDDWVDARAVDLRYKSYDQGHIDFIAERHDLDQVNDQLVKKGKEDKKRRKGNAD